MKKFDALLARVESMRSEPASSELANELRKLLSNRNGYLIGKAAALAAHHRLSDLIPDLVAAFDRLLINPVKNDPQCWGKNALITTLAELGYDQPAVYLTALTHVQHEPVWGGTEDTAATLRARSALALVECRSLSDTEVLRCLLPLLTDGDKTVRVAGAQAIARVNGPEAGLLLRLKALTGDNEPEVTGTCISGILSVEGTGAIDFARRFLNSEDPDIVAEAALALGLSRLPDAVTPIAERYRLTREESLASVLLTALAATHHQEAFLTLLRVVEQEGTHPAVSAIRAIVSAGGVSEQQHAALLAAANSNPDGRVVATLRSAGGKQETVQN